MSGKTHLAHLAAEYGSSVPPEIPPGRHRVIIRWPEVHRRTGRSRTQVWRDVRDGKFPAPVRLGPNAVGWYLDEIEQHLANLPRVTYAAEASA